MYSYNTVKLYKLKGTYTKKNIYNNNNNNNNDKQLILNSFVILKNNKPKFQT